MSSPKPNNFLYSLKLGAGVIPGIWNNDAVVVVGGAIVVNDWATDGAVKELGGGLVAELTGGWTVVTCGMLEIGVGKF